MIYQRHLNKYKEKKAQMVEANEAQLKKIIDEAIEENSYTILKFNNTCWENILKAEKSTADDIRHVESKLSEEIRLAAERIAGCLKSVKVNKAKQRDQAAHRMALTRNTLERKNKMALDALEVRLCNYRMRVVVANANYRSSVEYVIRSHITKASYKCFCARKFLHEENKEEEEIAKFIAIKGRYIVRTRYPVIQKRARGVKVY